MLEFRAPRTVSAVLAGLTGAMRDHRWTSKGKADSRVVVLVGDAAGWNDPEYAPYAESEPKSHPTHAASSTSASTTNRSATTSSSPTRRHAWSSPTCPTPEASNPLRS